LLLACLVIADLLYVYDSVMFEFIEEMLSNFSNFFSSTVVCRSIPGDCGFRGVTLGGGGLLEWSK
jgi:hypothetical protein